jgi:hypothetical protein
MSTFRNCAVNEHFVLKLFSGAEKIYISKYGRTESLQFLFIGQEINIPYKVIVSIYYVF